MAAARLEAWIAASDRALATPVLESASDSIFARPKSPIEVTTNATITSTRLKPRWRCIVIKLCVLMCNYPWRLFACSACPPE